MRPKQRKNSGGGPTNIDRVLNGRKYRNLNEASASYGGRWQYEYKGRWYPVLNYQIKAQLNAGSTGEDKPS